MEKDRQRPLSVKWASEAAAEFLKLEAGLSAGAASIAFDLTRTPDQEVSYPRSKSHPSYLCPKRYKNPLWKPGRIIGGMDELAKAELINHWPQLPGNRSAGWQSYSQAKPDLVELVSQAITYEPLGITAPRETVILRDVDRKLMDYQETGKTRTMRKNIAAQNEAIMGTQIGGCEVAAMVRYFNQTMQRGGRWIARGNSWQNAPRQTRADITIGGEATAELDYKTLHPGILYSMAGAVLPEDSYALKGWPRDLVKLALLVIINAKNRYEAIGAIAHSDGRKWDHDEGGNPIAFTNDRELMQVLAEPGSKEAQTLAALLIEQLTILHKPIAHFFGKDMGAKLMAIDSRMADAIMMGLLGQGITVLPVHDSFLVQASKVNELEAAMMKAAYAEGIRALKVERKKAPDPISPKQLYLL